MHMAYHAYAQAFEMRALVVLIDGVDEAAGLRDEIEAFIHQELVPSGNRVLVTSRPEGVTTARYRPRFVIMNLNALSNEQQRAAVSVQMQGSEFFEHLLSLGEVRKKLDEVYDKLRDSVQHDLAELYAPDRFLLPGKMVEEEKPWDPEQRQTIWVQVSTCTCAYMAQPYIHMPMHVHWFGMHMCLRRSGCR